MPWWARIRLSGKNRNGYIPRVYTYQLLPGKRYPINNVIDIRVTYFILLTIVCWLFLNQCSKHMVIVTFDYPRLVVIYCLWHGHCDVRLPSTSGLLFITYLYIHLDGHWYRCSWFTNWQRVHTGKRFCFAFKRSLSDVDANLLEQEELGMDSSVI